MKRLGIIGGTSWHSTIDYYRILNEGVYARFGGLNNAQISLHAIDFPKFTANLNQGLFDANVELLVEAAESLRAGGSAGLLLAANTLHLFAEAIRARVGLPLISLVEAVADEAKGTGGKRFALLGTRFTMTMGFYEPAFEASGLQIVVPDEQDRDFIHNAIYNELTQGQFSPETAKGMASVIEKMASQGCDGAILGCTEIPQLLEGQQLSVPGLDTTRIHAAAALKFMLD